MERLANKHGRKINLQPLKTLNLLNQRIKWILFYDVGVKKGNKILWFNNNQ